MLGSGQLRHPNDYPRAVIPFFALVVVITAAFVALSLLLAGPRQTADASFDFPPFRLVREEYTEGRHVATFELEWRGRNDWVEGLTYTDGVPMAAAYRVGRRRYAMGSARCSAGQTHTHLRSKTGVSRTFQASGSATSRWQQGCLRTGRRRLPAPSAELRARPRQTSSSGMRTSGPAYRWGTARSSMASWCGSRELCRSSSPTGR